MARRQASFGGVAALFGAEEEDAPVNNASNDAPASQSGGRRQASFGGVASLFGEEDLEVPNTVNIVDNTKQQESVSANTGGRRQPSFGGVAALFGASIEEDEDEQGQVQEVKQAGTSAGVGRRQASFGGVAALFGDEEEEEEDTKIPSTLISEPTKNTTQSSESGQAGGRTKKRDPSFSGVAELFGDADEEPESSKREKEEEKPNYDYSLQQADGLGDLEDIPKSNTISRSKKRDPSFGGVADLFSTPEDEEEEEEDMNVQDSQQQRIQIKQSGEKVAQLEKISQQLQQQVEKERIRVIQLTDDLHTATDANKELEKQLKQLEEQNNILIDSKIRLIRETAKEIDRMHDVMKELRQNKSEETNRSATVG